MKLAFSVLTCLLICSPSFGQIDEIAKRHRGTIFGSLQDLDGKRRKIEHVAIFVCDAKSGYPIVATTARPMEKDRPVHELEKLMFAVTDSSGQFQLKNVPVGRFRLVAQKWIGSDTIRWMKDKGDVPLELYGRAQATVTIDRNPKVVIRPYGDAKLAIRTTPDEGNAFLFVGLNAPLGEPILSFTGWGPEFTKNIVGLTHMNKGKTEIWGLPNDAKVYFSLLNYDNNPGVGGTEADTTTDTVATIPVYATWSNGYHTVPDHMIPLTKFLEDTDKSLIEIVRPGSQTEFTANGRPDYRKLYQWAEGHGSDTIELPELGQVRVIDILAAFSYQRIQQYHEDRKARQKE